MQEDDLDFADEVGKEVKLTVSKVDQLSRGARSRCCPAHVAETCWCVVTCGGQQVETPAHVRNWRGYLSKAQESRE